VIANRRVVLLAGPSRSTTIVYNALHARGLVDAVILERRVGRFAYLARRVRRLGLLRVIGQLLFASLALPVLRRAATERASELERSFGLDRSGIPDSAITRVGSVNDNDTRACLVALDPAVVVVNGTRKLSRRVFAACPRAVFLNMHAGITPAYRGVHGAYWAVVRRDLRRCGVTVHTVDAHIDTGPIVAQATIVPTARDNFVTYPLLQLGAGLPLLVAAVRGARDGILRTRAPTPGDSRLWSHPTLTEYLANWFRGAP